MLNDKPFLLRDVAFIERYLKVVMPVFRFLFGCDSNGFAHLQSGPYLFIANHNSGAAIEILALLDSWQKTQSKPVYGLAHRFGFKIPLLRTYLIKIGSIPATFEAAAETFKQGHSLLIFPGGAEEGTRSFRLRHQCSFYGHDGWVKIAIASRVSIVPISISGSHLVNPVLWQSQWLAKILFIPWLLRVSFFPVTLSQIVLAAVIFLTFIKLTPLWLTLLTTLLVFILTPLIPILPAKIKIKVGQSIDTETLNNDPVKIYNRVHFEIQKGMDQLRKN